MLQRGIRSFFVSREIAIDVTAEEKPRDFMGRPCHAAGIAL